MEKRTQHRTAAGVLGLGLALIANSQGFALGIGEIQVKSALNQPLYASIPLISSARDRERQESIRVRLASPEMHEQAGLRYPAELARSRFELYQGPDGQLQVLLGTREPIREPLMDFLLEVEWSHGKLLKEVSILLDPPEYQRLPAIESSRAPTLAGATPDKRRKTVAPAPPAKASLPPVTDIGAIDIPVFVEVPASLRRATRDTLAETHPVRKPRAPRSYRIENGQYGPVRPGDTLMDIARAAAKGTRLSAREMANRIYKANPDAFLGSMNYLERGSILYIPDATGARVKPVRSVEVAQARPGSDYGVSTITDFAFTLPHEEIEVEGETISAPTAAPAKEIERQPQETESSAAQESSSNNGARKSLEILPADKTSQRIAQDIARKLDENQKKDAASDAPSEAVTLDKEGDTPLPATNSSLKSAIGDSVEASPEPAAPESPAVSRDEFQQGETDREKGTVAAETPAEPANQEPLKAEIETNDLPKADETASRHFEALLKWLPWGVVLLALPLILLLMARRKPEPPVKIPPPEPRGLDSETPQPSVSERDRDLRPDRVPGIPDTTSEFAQSTVILENPSGNRDEAESNPFHTRETELDASDLEPEHDDLRPTSEDTQETIRPSGADNPNPSTQILDFSENLGGEGDRDLDAAQEAEIYLAYGQYSLAQVAIDKLRESNKNNDRFKLLQLKLYAETGKLEDMNRLASELLENSGAESGLSEQVRKITGRAQQRHGNERATGDALAEASGTEEAQPEDAGQNAPEPSSHLADTAAMEIPGQSFNEEIDDYLHSNPVAVAEIEDSDPIGDSLGSLTAEMEGDLTAETPEVSEEAFTDAELDAISMELDLMDDPGDSLEISDDLEDSYNHQEIENFSDTDYRLSPLGRDENARDKSERLDIPFDLESELEKLSQGNPSSKS
ncbi:MAG TPA: hypothetical protein ENK26_05090 [Gammaproteobacteria bacterium]|nr:hypothetical protein [Gammaproteobacteria bacterium]